MTTLLGILALLFGLQVFFGQLVSSFNFKLAQKLKLQEQSTGAEPLFRTLERNTAIWDSIVAWVLPLAGILMITTHDWWPYFALIAGGIYVDIGGRELAKWFGLRSKGVKTGTEKEFRIAQNFLGFTSILGLSLIIYALTQVT